MAKTYIFPDIHGCAKTIRYLLEEVVVPSREDKLIFLGDYIDRGPNSADVISILLSLINSDYHVIALRGNHEQMLLDSLSDDYAYRVWKLNSAHNTIGSYGGNIEETAYQEVANLIPSTHLQLLQTLPILYRQSSNLWCVHGCIHFPIEEKSLQQYLWLRPWECADSISEGVTVIHGHTPIPLKEVERQIALWGRLVNLDAGCVYAGMRDGLGSLVSLRLDDHQLFYTKNLDT